MVYMQWSNMCNVMYFYAGPWKPGSRIVNNSYGWETGHL